MQNKTQIRAVSVIAAEACACLAQATTWEDVLDWRERVRAWQAEAAPHQIRPYHTTDQRAPVKVVVGRALLEPERIDWRLLLDRLSADGDARGLQIALSKLNRTWADAETEAGEKVTVPYATYLRLDLAQTRAAELAPAQYRQWQEQSARAVQTLTAAQLRSEALHDAARDQATQSDDTHANCVSRNDRAGLLHALQQLDAVRLDAPGSFFQVDLD